MRIIRYVKENEKQLAAVTNENKVVDLPFIDFMSLIETARQKNKTAFDIVKQIVAEEEKQPLEGLKLTTPIDAPEVWASGVTYKKARKHVITKQRKESLTAKRSMTKFMMQCVPRFSLNRLQQEP